MIIAAPSGSRSALATAVCIRVQGFWTTLQEKQMPKDTYETAQLGSSKLAASDSRTGALVGLAGPFCFC